MNKLKEKPASVELSSDETDVISNLFDEKPSIDLTPSNSRFFASAGGLISLEVTNGSEEASIYERVIVLRSFPLTNPDVFLSVRLPDDKERGRGREVGLIGNINDFDEETRTLIKNELEMRYYTPNITKITGIKEKLGYYYWDVETDSGDASFVLNSPFSTYAVWTTEVLSSMTWRATASVWRPLKVLTTRATDG